MVDEGLGRLGEASDESRCFFILDRRKFFCSALIESLMYEAPMFPKACPTTRKIIHGSLQTNGCALLPNVCRRVFPAHAKEAVQHFPLYMDDDLQLREEHKSGAVGVYRATFFEKVLSSGQRIKNDHRLRKDSEMDDVAFGKDCERSPRTRPECAIP